MVGISDNSIDFRRVHFSEGRGAHIPSGPVLTTAPGPLFTHSILRRTDFFSPTSYPTIRLTPLRAVRTLGAS
jgi:hypothetical protein